MAAVTRSWYVGAVESIDCSMGCALNCQSWYDVTENRSSRR